MGYRTNNVDMVIRAHDKASKKFGQVNSAMGRFVTGLKRVAVAAGAVLAAREIIRFGKESVGSFMAQEKAVDSLGDALDLLGQKNKRSMKEMLSFASQVQQLTTIGDEATIELMSMGASMGKLSGDTLKAATVAAIGLSKAFKMDLQAAMRLVSRAAQGDTQTLARYGIKLEDGLSAQEKFNKVLEIGTENFKLAQGEIDTSSGAMEQLKNKWGDVKEVVGGWIARLVPPLIKSFNFLEVAVKNWRLSLSLAFKTVTLKAIEFVLDFKHLFTKKLPAYLIWFKDNWAAIFLDLHEGTKTIFKNMWTNIKSFFEAFKTWLAGGDFEFQWTGLLEGFKKTMSDLPEVADREFTKLEIALQRNIAELKKQFEKELQIELPDLNVKEMLKNAGLGGAGGAGGADKKKSTPSRRTSETFHPLQQGRLHYLPGTQLSASRLESNGKRQISLLEGIREDLKMLKNTFDRNSLERQSLQHSKLGGIRMSRVPFI